MNEYYFLVDSFKPIISNDINDSNIIKLIYCSDNVIKLNKLKFDKIYNLYEKYINDICKILNTK